MKKILIVDVPDGMLLDYSIMAYDEKDLAYCLECKEVHLPAEDERLKHIENLSIGINMQSRGVESRLKTYDKWLIDKILNQ